ncbi:hypothetical protein HPB48_010884 [Haemaphysalis longicornis]|uniref:Uncharacterized protein n=1 Tax=Haemaphysalis longicornis TaxID=44386 RepID=A0A9J6G926_HAELO|nr:hypothetical protein HPB48_010884 [Haemaphysalis longicornis]
MTEVEALCSRIGIMGGGRLQCLGSLKIPTQKFGKGYAITINTLPDRTGDIIYQPEVQQAANLLFPESDLVHTYKSSCWASSVVWIFTAHAGKYDGCCAIYECSE